MSERVDIAFGGHALQLLADRALLWPEESILAIADLHLGKGDTFRAHGIAIPSGGTAHDLARLDRLLQQTGANTLLVLGDFLHGAQLDSSWRALWDAFRQRWSDVNILIVVGNHDRALPRANLQRVTMQPAWLHRGIHFCHDVSEATPPSIGGHVHPVIRIPGEMRRLPVFWQRAEQIILPSFSAFTGGYPVKRAPSEALYACNGDQVTAL